MGTCKLAPKDEGILEERTVLKALAEYGGTLSLPSLKGVVCNLSNIQVSRAVVRLVQKNKLRITADGKIKVLRSAAIKRADSTPPTNQPTSPGDMEALFDNALRYVSTATSDSPVNTLSDDGAELVEMRVFVPKKLQEFLRELANSNHTTAEYEGGHFMDQAARLLTLANVIPT